MKQDTETLLTYPHNTLFEAGIDFIHKGRKEHVHVMWQQEKNSPTNNKMIAFGHSLARQLAEKFREQNP